MSQYDSRLFGFLRIHSSPGPEEGSQEHKEAEEERVYLTQVRQGQVTKEERVHLTQVRQGQVTEEERVYLTQVRQGQVTEEERVYLTQVRQGQVTEEERVYLTQVRQGQVTTYYPVQVMVRSKARVGEQGPLPPKRPG